MELTNIDRDINFVIMDYLINEGYPVAAQKFAKEADIVPSSDGEAIQERVDIRNAIHAGNIQLAIERINELNPQVRVNQPFILHIFPSIAVIILCFMHHAETFGSMLRKTLITSVLSMSNVIQLNLHMSPVPA